MSCSVDMCQQSRAERDLDRLSLESIETDQAAFSVLPPYLNVGRGTEAIEDIQSIY